MKGFNIMTLISSTRFFNGALLAGAMALISTEVAVAQPAPGTADSSGRLVQTCKRAGLGSLCSDFSRARIRDAGI